ncbi:MAG: hypothetical protein ACRDWD_17675 [Acidimicrobiia bacterium]
MSDDAAPRVLVRVWLPDRPGALGQVASRIGAVRGDIVGIDVLERSDDVAVDEFAVDLDDAGLVPVLIREIEEVDGVSVEQVKIVDHFPDPRLDALDSAEVLCRAESLDELQEVLVAHVREEFLADWSALVADGTRVALDGGDAPGDAALAALVAGTSASPSVANGLAGPDDIAIATFPARGATLVLGRQGRPFRQRERQQLLMLTRIADRVSSLLDRHPALGST